MINSSISTKKNWIQETAEPEPTSVQAFVEPTAVSTQANSVCTSPNGSGATFQGWFAASGGVLDFWCIKTWPGGGFRSQKSVCGGWILAKSNQTKAGMPSYISKGKMYAVFTASGGLLDFCHVKKWLWGGFRVKEKIKKNISRAQSSSFSCSGGQYDRCRLAAGNKYFFPTFGGAGSGGMGCCSTCHTAYTERALKPVFWEFRIWLTGLQWRHTCVWSLCQLDVR